MERTEGGHKPDAVDTPQVPADEARQALGDLLDRAFKGERTIITRHGKPVAGLVGMDDLRRLVGDAA